MTTTAPKKNAPDAKTAEANQTQQQNNDAGNQGGGEQGANSTDTERKEETKSPEEIAEANPKIFGNEASKPGDVKTARDRQPDAMMTADQRHAVENKGKPLNKAAKTEDGQIELGDRVMLHTATPIGGQTINPAFVIGFTDQGLPNLRLELLDGAMSRPMEFGGVPQNTAREERGPFWTWPHGKRGAKASTK